MAYSYSKNGEPVPTNMSYHTMGAYYPYPPPGSYSGGQDPGFLHPQTQYHVPTGPLPAYPGLVDSYTSPEMPQLSDMRSPAPPQNPSATAQAPPPMRISGNTISNLTTGQIIYTISHNNTSSLTGSPSQFSLVHAWTGSTIGQARRHTLASNVITVNGLSSKLKRDEVSFSERWVYQPTWTNGSAKWYFKHPRKSDLRLVDARHSGREVLTVKGDEVIFLGQGLRPEQVGELLLAVVVLREDLKEGKEAEAELGQAVLEAVLAG